MSSVALWIIPGLTKIRALLYSFALSLDGLGIFLVAITDSSFLTIPEGNDLLIVILSTGSSWHRMLTYVAITIAGSVTGCLLLYAVGRSGGSPLLHRRFAPANVQRAESLFARYGVLAVVIPSVLPPPCPFKIFVLSAGVFRLDWAKFLFAVTLGRTVRYSTWGVLALLYGNSVKVFIVENLEKVGFTLLLGLGVVASVTLAIYILMRRKARRRGAA